MSTQQALQAILTITWNDQEAFKRKELLYLGGIEIPFKTSDYRTEVFEFNTNETLYMGSVDLANFEVT